MQYAGRLPDLPATLTVLVSVIALAAHGPAISLRNP